MDIMRIAAFSDGATGGNPAGVLLADQHPTEAEMQKIAASVGYSETAFAFPQNDGWRVRYFSPESEVPFCGHATIALGAAIASQKGDGVFSLALNEATITVEGQCEGDMYSAALQSPPTLSKAIEPALLTSILNLFSYAEEDLDRAIPPAWIHAGADHALIALNAREKLKSMAYPFAQVRDLMIEAGLITILFAWSESAGLFHTRNAFASGGVVEDPATGAATAALAGYLRDLDWPHNGTIEVVQGEDMGSKSLLRADISAQTGGSIRVSGTARFM